MKKKIVAVALTLALVMGMSTIAFAADKVTSKLTLDGQLNVVENTQTKLGEITVSLSSVTAEP